jgi:hypothetical protein
MYLKGLFIYVQTTTDILEAVTCYAAKGLQRQSWRRCKVSCSVNSTEKGRLLNELNVETCQLLHNYQFSGIDPRQTRSHQIHFIYFCRVAYFEMFKKKKSISFYPKRTAISTRSTFKNIHSSLVTEKLFTFLSTSTEICDKFVEEMLLFSDS